MSLLNIVHANKQERIRAAVERARAAYFDVYVQVSRLLDEYRLPGNLLLPFVAWNAAHCRRLQAIAIFFHHHLQIHTIREDYND